MSIKKKSQIFSLDMIISLGIFVIILIASAWSWDSIRERIYLSEQRNDLEMIARNVASVLLETNGNPSDWYNVADFSESTVSSIGLAKNTPFLLDTKKTLKLKDLCNNPADYSTVKNILGIKGPGYEFFINITSYNNGIFSSNGLCLKPDSSAEDVVVVERMTADVQWSRVTIYVWRKT